MSPPGAVSPIGGKFRGLKFLSLQGHVPNTNALAYARFITCGALDIEMRWGSMLVTNTSVYTGGEL